MTAEIQSGFGALLRRHRIDAGLTQEDLAERAGISARAVSDLERGVYAKPRFDTLRRLARVLALSSEEQATFEQGVLRAGRADDAANANGLAEQRLPMGGFLGALPTGPLVGRGVEQAKVLSAADAAHGGAGRLVFITGEPGVGKTRLAQEITGGLQSRGFLVAAGRCSETDETTPYYPFVEALAILHRLTPPALRETMVRDWPHLAVLLPEERAHVRSEGGIDDQQILFYGVVRLLEALSERAPLALMLDDLHWADASSLKLLRHLVHHTRTLPVFLLGTYRDVEVGRQHLLEGVLRDLERAELAERVQLRRLNSTESEALIRTTLGELDASVAAVLHDRTEGNPFFLQQIVRSLTEQGAGLAEDGRGTQQTVAEMGVPESIKSAIGHRLSRLTSNAQEVLHEASVLGQRFRFADLLGMSGRSEDTLDAALVEAGRAGLVRDEGDDSLAFDHALTQQTLYDELSARGRRRLHRTAGLSIEGLPERKRKARGAELARHFLLADDTTRALTYSLLAGEEALAALGYPDAERHFRTALELAEELEDERSRARAAEKLGEVVGLAGRNDEAVAAYELAADLYHALADLEGESRTIAELGAFCFFRGTAERSIERTHAMLATLGERGPPATLVRLWHAEAMYYWSKLQIPEADKCIARAVHAARKTEDPLLLARALVAAAPSTRAMGYRDEALSFLQEGASLAEKMGDRFWLTWAMQLQGDVYFFDGHMQIARQYFERAVELAHRMGNDDLGANNRGEIATTQFYLGHWEQAERDFGRALQLASVAGASWGRWWALTGSGLLHASAGRWDAAEQRLADALSLIEQHEDVQWRVDVYVTLAELAVLRGAAEQALHVLEPALRLFSTVSTVENNWTGLGWALLYLGRIDEAREFAASGLHPTSGKVPRLFVPAWLELAGAVAIAQQRWQDAAKPLGQGLAEARDMGLPYHEGRLLYHLGLMLARQGDAAGARARLQEAQAIFQQLGALPYLERTERALAELASSPG